MTQAHVSLVARFECCELSFKLRKFPLALQAIDGGVSFGEDLITSLRTYRTCLGPKVGLMFAPRTQTRAPLATSKTVRNQITSVISFDGTPKDATASGKTDRQTDTQLNLRPQIDTLPLDGIGRLKTTLNKLQRTKFNMFRFAGLTFALEFQVETENGTLGRGRQTTHFTCVLRLNYREN